MKAAIVILGLALAGCATEPRVVDRVVHVGVPVQCKAEKPQRPVMPTEVLAADADDFTVVRAHLAEVEIREGYEGLLVAALDQCLQAPIKAAR